MDIDQLMEEIADTAGALSAKVRATILDNNHEAARGFAGALRDTTDALTGLVETATEDED
jgi:hypothetical protein